MKISFDYFTTLNPQQKQRVLFYGCIGGAATVLSIVIWNTVFAGNSYGSTHGAAPTEKILTGANRLNPQDAWNERMSNQFDSQEKEISELKRMIGQVNETLKTVNGAASNIARHQESLPSSQGAGQGLGQTPSSTLMQQSPLMNTSSQGGAHSSNPGVLDLSFEGEGRSPLSHDLHPSSGPKAQTKRFRSKGISKQAIALHNSKIGKQLETVDNTIPAGSFAQGILLSGVDASTSTSASANPEPVLIELTDSGDLSRYFTSTVKGCRVTASGYGVLSKERVMMRLEKLSCIEVATGEVMTAEVDGYVSGEDGKLGLRGTVVDRAGDHVRAAMVGGFLSSFGNFLAASSNPVTFASQTGLAQITPMSGQELLKHGGAKGVSGALDKYTEFYIKRAEQLEPVIQIGAGRIVQVVFNKTVGIGKTAFKQLMSSKNDRARSQTLEQHRVDD
jgi:conjugal transfer pilus assembly protein TraB